LQKCLFNFYSFSGDPYLNYTLTILAELPSIPFAYFVVNRWGRRPMLGFMQLLSGEEPVKGAFGDGEGGI
jgi:hypothetical protein